MDKTTAPPREFELQNEEFEFLRALVKERTGINLSTGKRELVYGRLAKRLRQLQLGSFAEYCDMLREDRDGELGHMVNAITTNLTAFFRERHHFDYVVSELMPRVMQARASSRRIRIWCAGCSSGEEPYSLAMSLREAFPELGSWDLKILATDLDTTVLDRARLGVYPVERINVLPNEKYRKWFSHCESQGRPSVEVDERLKEMIAFKKLNLMDEWPMKGPFDAIFCRNVLIYFARLEQKMIVERFADLLQKDGVLFLGHSESLYQVTDRFEPLGSTIYARLE